MSKFMQWVDGTRTQACLTPDLCLFQSGALHFGFDVLDQQHDIFFLEQPLCWEIFCQEVYHMLGYSLF